MLSLEEIREKYINNLILLGDLDKDHPLYIRHEGENDSIDTIVDDPSLIYEWECEYEELHKKTLEFRNRFKSSYHIDYCLLDYLYLKEIVDDEQYHKVNNEIRDKEILMDLLGFDEILEQYIAMLQKRCYEYEIKGGNKNG